MMFSALGSVLRSCVSSTELFIRQRLNGILSYRDIPRIDGAENGARERNQSSLPPPVGRDRLRHGSRNEDMQQPAGKETQHDAGGSASDAKDCRLSENQ